MNVREIMTTEITKATPDNTLVDIAAVMRDEDIGAVPVVDDDELIGIVTDRDIVVRAIAGGKDPSTTNVEEILSREVESVEPGTDIIDAADLMASRQLRRLPVVEDGELIGMVSLGDIAVKHEEGTAAYALEGVSEGVKATKRTGRAGSTESKAKGASERATAQPKKTVKTTRHKGSRRAA